MEQINTLRGEIDDIDELIITLLDRRLDLCERVGILKKQHNIPITHNNRETDIISNLTEQSQNLLHNDVENIYNEIFNISKNRQRNLI